MTNTPEMKKFQRVTHLCVELPGRMLTERATSAHVAQHVTTAGQLHHHVNLYGPVEDCTPKYSPVLSYNEDKISIEVFMSTNYCLINKFLNQSINQLVQHSINQFIAQSINQSIGQAFDQSIHCTINQSINQVYYDVVKVSQSAT